MPMSRKDYRAIARAIRCAMAVEYGEDGAAMVNRIVVNLERELKQDNIRFDKDKFRRAIFGPYSLDTI